nr:hypothetical protein [Tanacetum cinerariifolium]
VTAASVEDSDAPTTATTADNDDKLTLAKTLHLIKAAKPKVISTAITTPKAKENVEESLKKTQAEVTEGGSKRAGQVLEQEKIVPEDDDDVAIKATPLSSKSPTIVDYKIYIEWKKSYFKIIMADGNSQNYLTFGTMFKNFNRDDLEVLRSIVKERFKKTKPVDDMENLLFQTLKTSYRNINKE